MAVYGKKRNIDLGFTKFQDASSADDANEIRAFKRKKCKIRLKGKPSARMQVRASEVGSSADDLAENADGSPAELSTSLDHVSFLQPQPRTTRRRLTKPRKMPLRKSQTLSHLRKASSSSRDDSSDSASRISKLQISSPIGPCLRQSSASGSIIIDFPEATHLGSATGHPAAVRGSSTSVDAANLEQRISSAVARQSYQQHEQMNLLQSRSSTSVSLESKRQPLARSKEALQTAKRIISHQIVPESKREHQALKKIHDAKQKEIEEIMQNAHPSCTAEAPGETKEEAVQRRLNRRIAEGANLSNPKIRSLTGHGKITRKPHRSYGNIYRPARYDSLNEEEYDGMYVRSRSESFISGYNSTRVSEDSSNFTMTNVAGSGQSLGPHAPLEQLPSCCSSPFAPQSPSDALQSSPGQGSDFAFHEESLLAHSTPRLEDHRRENSSSYKRLSTITASSDEDDPDEKIITSSNIQDFSKLDSLGRSEDTTLKRKSAKLDLRCSSLQFSENSVPNGAALNGNSRLANEVNRSHTARKNVLLADKDGNKMSFPPISSFSADGLKIAGTISDNECIPGKWSANTDASVHASATSKPSLLLEKPRRPLKPSRLPRLSRSRSGHALSSVFNSEESIKPDYLRLPYELDAVETERAMTSSGQDSSPDELQMA